MRVVVGSDGGMVIYLFWRRTLCVRNKVRLIRLKSGKSEYDVKVTNLILIARDKLGLPVYEFFPPPNFSFVRFFARSIIRAKFFRTINDFSHLVKLHDVFEYNRMRATSILIVAVIFLKYMPHFHYMARSILLTI